MLNKGNKVPQIGIIEPSTTQDWNVRSRNPKNTSSNMSSVLRQNLDHPEKEEKMSSGTFGESKNANVRVH